MAFNLPANPMARRWFGLMPAMLTIFVFMVIPIIILGVFSFKPADPYGGVDPGFSLEAWVQLFFERDLDDSLIFEPVYLQIILRSIFLGLLATLASLLMGFPVAWYIVQQPTQSKETYYYCFSLPSLFGPIY